MGHSLNGCLVHHILASCLSHDSDWEWTKNDHRTCVCQRFIHGKGESHAGNDKVLEGPTPVFVRTQTSREMPLHVDLSGYVEDIRELIHHAEYMPPDLQRLAFDGQYLQPGRTLLDYGVGDNAMIYLMHRVHGGGHVSALLPLYVRILNHKTVAFAFPKFKDYNNLTMVEEIEKPEGISASQHSVVDSLGLEVGIDEYWMYNIRRNTVLFLDPATHGFSSGWCSIF